MDNFIEDAIYLNEVVKKAREDGAKVLNIKLLPRYFGIRLFIGEEDKCFNGLLGNTIIVKDRNEEGLALIYYAIFVGYFLTYLHHNPKLEHWQVIYDSNTKIEEDYYRLYRYFARDLLIEENNLENVIKEGRGYQR